MIRKLIALALVLALSLTMTAKRFVIRESAKAGGMDSNGRLAAVSTAKGARFELLDNYCLTPPTALCKALLEQTTSEEIATGIASPFTPSLEGTGDGGPFTPPLEGTGEASLSNDIAAVRYYNLQGQRVGYALEPGQTVIAHIVLRNGASMVRKIVVGK